MGTGGTDYPQVGTTSGEFIIQMDSTGCGSEIPFDQHCRDNERVTLTVRAPASMTGQPSMLCHER